MRDLSPLVLFRTLVVVLVALSLVRALALEHGLGHRNLRLWDRRRDLSLPP